MTTEEKSEADDASERQRGVLALDLLWEVIFTKKISVSPEQLRELGFEPPVGRRSEEEPHDERKP